MQPAPAIPLEKLAAIDARLEAGVPRDRVFAEAGVTSEVWARAKDAWFARMASEAIGGKGRKLHKRYHDLLGAERKATVSDPRQTPSKLKGKAPKPPVARLSPLAAQYRPDAPRVSSVSSRPEAAESPSGVFRAPAVAGALPFLPSTVPNPAVPTNPPAAPKPTRSEKATVMFDMLVDEAQTLLHKGGESKTVLPFVSMKPAPASFDETSEPVRSPLRKDVLPFVQTKPKHAAVDQTSTPQAGATRDGLPFVAAQRAPSPSTPPPPAAARKPSAPPPAAFAADPLEQTRFNVVVPRAEPLPFVSGAMTVAAPVGPSTNPLKSTGLPFQPAAQPAQSSPSQPPPPNAQMSNQGFGAKGTLGDPQPQMSNHGLPFQRSVAPTVANARPGSQAPPPNTTEPLDLTRYACLCAELARFPEDSERIFGRYGLAEPQLRASVDATWRARLGQDPQLYRTWQEYYQHYFTQWFGQGRKM